MSSPSASRGAGPAALHRQTVRWYEVLGAALFSATLLEDNSAPPTLLHLAESFPPVADAQPAERAAFAQVAVSAMNIYGLLPPMLRHRSCCIRAGHDRAHRCR